jgi:hypothetical protein
MTVSLVASVIVILISSIIVIIDNARLRCADNRV